MVNGPPCTVCGYPLRWFGDQNAWGCDRCQRLFPVQPTVQSARPHSKLPLVLGIAAIAVAGGIVAAVMLAKGGGGGAGQASARELADKTVAALSKGDVAALLDLTGMDALHDTAIKCDSTADPEMNDLDKMKAKARDEFTRAADKAKGLTLAVAAMPDLDGSKDTVFAKGKEMSKGCVAGTELRFVGTKLKISVKEGDKPASEQEARMEMAVVDGKWYLLEPPAIEKPSGSKTGFDAQLDVLEGLEEQMCACHDPACAQGVQEMMKKTTDEMLQHVDPAKPSGETQQRAQKISDGYAACMQKAMGGGAQIATGAGGLPKQCDDWKAAIEKLATCPKVTPQIIAAQRQAYDRSIQAWSSMPDSSKAQLAPGCKNLADGIAQMRASLCP